MRSSSPTAFIDLPRRRTMGVSRLQQSNPYAVPVWVRGELTPTRRFIP